MADTKGMRQDEMHFSIEEITSIIGELTLKNLSLSKQILMLKHEIVAQNKSTKEMKDG